MSEYIPYILTISAAVCFGCQFFFQKRYERAAGTSLAATAVFTIGTSTIGALFMLALLGFTVGVNSFTLLIAALCALNNTVNTCFSLKSMGKVTVSVFVLFCMLGGMVLPFAVGLLFFGERMTLGKGIAFALIVLALFLGNRWEKQGKALVYCLIVFVTNGMSGVFSTIYQRGDEAINATVYSFWLSVLSFALSVLLLCTVKVSGRLKKRQRKEEGGEGTSDGDKPARTFRFILLAFIIPVLGVGLLNRGGNLLLLFGLADLDASLQYPLLTGGTILVSTVISLLCREKISLRSWLGVLCAIAATVIIIL